MGIKQINRISIAPSVRTVIKRGIDVVPGLSSRFQSDGRMGELHKTRERTEEVDEELKFRAREMGRQLTGRELELMILSGDERRRQGPIVVGVVKRREGRRTVISSSPPLSSG